MSAAHLTLGTAGHIDHGKTALVRALTGIDTDRLPQERSRGISIELGYAPLRLPDGRSLSVVDVPGHERFVRTMVAGASGIDLFLLVIAADDGVMPQTVEHAQVLRALDVTSGVVAVTKGDLADPTAALAGARELLADWATVELVGCSARTGAGLGDLAQALQRVAGGVPSRASAVGPSILHVDRSFTIHGAGTVITGTLWSGEVARGDRLSVLPRGLPTRVRAVQVHDEPVDSAAAGQRVALNLAGVRSADVARGDVVADPGAVAASHILSAELGLHASSVSRRVKVHHGTRASTGRLVPLGSSRWELRVERPLLARAGDRVVIRGIAPPSTLGGGVIVDPHPRRRARQPAERAQPTERTEAVPRAAVAELSSAAIALEERLRAAGHTPLSVAQLGDDAAELPALIAAGRAVRIGRAMHAHPDALAAVRERAIAVLEAEGELTLARLRDELQVSRKYAEALIEHLDATRVTLRRPDDTRVLRRQSQRPSGTPR
jgi:selenocysteine-specific elongation factor